MVNGLFEMRARYIERFRSLENNLCFALVLGNISPGSAEAGPSKPKNVTPTTSRGKITSFFDRMTPEEQERSSECLARAVYGTGLPFHTFENPLWIEAFKTLRPGFKPPNAKLLGG